MSRRNEIGEERKMKMKNEKGRKNNVWNRKEKT
jgi:hypothetical protein